MNESVPHASNLLPLNLWKLVACFLRNPFRRLANNLDAPYKSALLDLITDEEDSKEVYALWVAKKSASWRISRSSSSVEGCITHGRKDETSFAFAQRAIRYEVDGSPAKPLK